MLKIFKRCSIQSDKQVHDKSDSKEGVEDRNDSFKEVDMLNNSENFVVDGSDPKSDPNGATHTINGILSTDTTNEISTRNYIHCSSSQPSKPLKQGLEQVLEAQSA